MTYSTGDLIDRYLVLRDKVEGITAEFEQSIKRYKDGMKAIETEMLRRLNEGGQQSAKAESGSICFKQTVSSYKVADREAWFNWVLSDWPNRSLCLTTHVAKDQLKELDKVPPGVELTQILKVNFRKG